MIILGRAACGDYYSMSATPTSVDGANTVILMNGAYDEVFITSTVYTTWDGTIPKDWDFNTKIHALFQESLFGGNVNFTAETVTSVLVKKRKKGELEWQSIYEIPISSNDDFIFMRQDFYNRSGVEYEYCLVPTLNEVEGNYSTNYNISNILSKFSGVFLVEKSAAYHAIMDVEVEYERRWASSIVETKGRRYPFAIYNGNSNYDEIDVTASFTPFKENGCTPDFSNIHSYLKEVDNFLTNRHPKILKTQDGRMWMVCITDDISHEENGSYRNVNISFTATETGDCEDVNDLYNNGFIDCDWDVNRSY